MYTNTHAPPLFSSFHFVYVNTTVSCSNNLSVHFFTKRLSLFSSQIFSPWPSTTLMISLITPTVPRIDETVANALIALQLDQQTREILSQPCISATWYHVLFLLLFSTTLYMRLYDHVTFLTTTTHIYVYILTVAHSPTPRTYKLGSRWSFPFCHNELLSFCQPRLWPQPCS